MTNTDITNALERPRDILREAFTAATKQIGEETGHEVWTSA